MNNIDQKIQERISDYYSLIGADHHKDRDCWFNIEKVWCSYKDEVSYRVYHNGYINDFEQEFDTSTKAHKYLLLKLEELIKECLKSIEDPQVDWLEYVPQEHYQYLKNKYNNKEQ